MELKINQALQQGINAHKEGEIKEAEHLYRAILKSQPTHPDANHNLGLIAVSVNKAGAALPLFKKALESSPKIEQFWFSYIDALIKEEQFETAKQVLADGEKAGLVGEKFNSLEEKLNNNIKHPSQKQLSKLFEYCEAGRYGEAENLATLITQRFPEHQPTWKVLGAVFEQTSRKAKALVAKQKVVELSPQDAGSHYNVGVILQELGRIEEATASYSKSIELKSDNATSHYNLGTAFYQLHRNEDAISSYNKAIELRPDYIEAYNNLANILRDMNRNREAVSMYNKAIKINPSQKELYMNLGLVLPLLKTVEFSHSLVNIYLNILNFETSSRPVDMDASIITLLKYFNTINEAIGWANQTDLKPRAGEFCISLSEIPLFLKFIELTPVTDLEIETLLSSLRKTLLFERPTLSNKKSFLSFQCSLALQCFTNEFIYAETEEETVAIKALENTLHKDFLNKKNLSPFDLACLASYRPLHHFAWTKGLVSPPGLDSLLKRQVVEVNHEIFLREDIPRLKPIMNKVSIEVQNQYEENPYPRWINTRLNIPMTSVADFTKKMNLRLVNKTKHLSDELKVLVAGCGTGQHSVTTATRFTNSHVIAIDLSLTSLGYAKRKTNELGIKNIDYMQADILDLRLLGKEFDIIESSGVLHHMADPIKGWSILTDILKPGGIMRIGLYSETARKAIVKARGIIAESNILPDKKNMRLFRQKLIELNDPILNTLQHSPDFFSISSFRDLLFHAQEHRYTIPKISKLLDKLGLTFLGFQFSNPQAINSFKLNYPTQDALYDLDKWHEFETLNPNLFSGMYQFWTQKVIAH